MTGLFEIWQFSCRNKKGLINSLVGRNVSRDYLVRGVFLPAGLPYRLSCVYRCLQAQCNMTEQDNSCWILDSSAVKFSQNSETFPKQWSHFEWEFQYFRESQTFRRHNKFPRLFGIEIDWLTLSSKKCSGVQEWIDLTRKSMKGKRPACLFHHASYMPPSFSLPLSRLSARQNHAQSRASLFKICLDLHNVNIEGRI